MVKLLTKDGVLIYEGGVLCTSPPSDCCCICDPTPTTLSVQQSGTALSTPCGDCGNWWANPYDLDYDPDLDCPCRWSGEFEWTDCDRGGGSVTNIDTMAVELCIKRNLDGDVVVTAEFTYTYLGNFVTYQKFEKTIVGDVDCSAIGDLPLVQVSGSALCFENDANWVCTVTL